MATVYKFKVRCVSPFCSFKSQKIKKIIEEALIKWQDEETRLKLESIEVNETKE
jgi:hypothetical protein